MSNGQWRVFVLLLVLLGLEILRSGPVHSFFTGLFSSFTSSTGSSSSSSQDTFGSSQRAKLPNYPPGSKGSKPQ